MFLRTSPSSSEMGPVGICGLGWWVGAGVGEERERPWRVASVGAAAAGGGPADASLWFGYVY